MMLNEAWEQRRLALTTLTKAAVFLPYVVVLNKHEHTCTCIAAHTEAACSCVFWWGADRAPAVCSGSAAHALCLRCARWPPVVGLTLAQYNLKSTDSLPGSSFSPFTVKYFIT